MSPTEAKRLAREWRRRTEGRVALLLDNVQNPFNVGSIARTAAALRVEHVYLVGNTPPPNHPSARKTGLGTERYLTWSEYASVADALETLRGDGLSLVGVELTGSAQPLHEMPLADDVCLAVGHEDRGLSPAALAACSAVAYVPLLGKVGSLNVASATAIALYEVRRQQWARPPAGPPSNWAEDSPSQGASSAQFAEGSGGDGAESGADAEGDG